MLLFVVVPVHLALIVLSALGYPEMFQVDIRGADGTGLYIVFTIAAGYAFFSWFIRTEGARTLRLSEEMRLAARIHESLVPDIHIKTDRVEVFARSRASTEMGGDLIDVVSGDDGSISLYLADVSGHGRILTKPSFSVRLSHCRARSSLSPSASLAPISGPTPAAGPARRRSTTAR